MASEMICCYAASPSPRLILRWPLLSVVTLDGRWRYYARDTVAKSFSRC